MSTQNLAKKKLMFSKGDDFYFLTYNILLILGGLGCVGDRVFKDYRKMAFLIDFISNRNLAITLKDSRPILNPIDRESFTRAYADGMLRLNQIIRLLFTLEKQGLIILQRVPGKDTIDISLNKDADLSEFFNKELFNLEEGNLLLIKNSISRLTALTLETLLTRLFDNHGIKTWQA